MSESGQSIVLISVLILSFMLFFAFVINTGVLVTAKISLQTAADAAAYAGAAVQARQLNSISYLNYDLRKQYKKFIYRYVVVGNFSRDKFERGADPTGNYKFPIKDIDPTTLVATWPDLNVPVICIPITVSGAPDDTCVIASRPNTSHTIKSSIGIGAALNGSTLTMMQQIEAIERVQTNICAARGQVNLYVALAWLFRAKIDQAALQSFFDLTLNSTTLSAPDKAKVVDVVKTVTDRLGIFPRNIITQFRINTLQDYLNMPPLTDVDFELVKNLEKKKSADENERTIQAFRSAYSNLNENTFPEGVKLTELQNPKQIKLNTLKVSFITYVQQIDQAVGTTGPKSCVMKVIGIPIVDLPVGVNTDSTANLFVHYAVKLSAKVKLFLPSPLSVDLEAIAGTKPFGSRIGPKNLVMEDFVEPLQPGPIINNPDILAACTGTSPCMVPNLKLMKNPAPGVKSLTQNYLKEIGGQLRSNPVTSTELKNTMDLATAPNPYEVGQYNILPAPPSSPDMMKYENTAYWMEPKGGNPARPIYRFYAPIFPDSKTANMNDEVKKALNLMFPTVNAGGPNPNGYDPAQVRDLIESQLLPYITKNLVNPTNGNTENDESYTFAAVDLPIPARNLPSGKYWLTKSEEVLTSWAPDYVRTGPNDYNGSGTFKPRFGYSVKFVTMQDLLSQGMVESDDDLTKLKH